MHVLLVTNMYPTPDRPAAGIFVAEQVASLERLGVTFDVLYVDGRRSSLNYAWGVPRLWAQLRRARYDLIHAHYVFSGWIARLQWGRPLVLTHHGIEVLTGWTAPLCRWASRWADQVIVVSQAMQRALAPIPSHVIPCGVDLTLFRPGDRAAARAALGLEPDRPLVLFAGDLRPEKRYPLAQAAVAHLRAMGTDAALVTLTGQPHDRVPLYMQACDVLILTSTHEGSPMVVKEAMACNLPVVSVDVGDVAEVIGGTEGCVVAEADPEKLAMGLQRALAHGRTNGRAAVERFDLDRVARQVLEVYRMVMEEAA
ncbi:MAG: glycosyltransferase family 4 protein [Chloroflexi bacterium]|nr:glycosyltransferase family 4 protein [Chloroflexota bacterium]